VPAPDDSPRCRPGGSADLSRHRRRAGPLPELQGGRGGVWIDARRRGAQALREQGHRLPENTDWTERNKRAGAKFIEHTLAIADFLVQLELACRERTDVELIREHDVIAEAPDSTRIAREPLRLVVPGLDNKIGVSSVIADGLFGLVFPDGTASYYLLEVDRGSMPVVRTQFDRTSYNRKLKVYWEAWKQNRHVEHFGIKQRAC
jgi:Replication-relaxation